MSEWQTIDTAPKDGSRILVCVFKKKLAVTRFVDGYWAVYKVDRDKKIMQWLKGPTDWLVLSEDPTHWMPLPEPPK